MYKSSESQFIIPIIKKYKKGENTILKINYKFYKKVKKNNIFLRSSFKYLINLKYRQLLYITSLYSLIN